MKRIVLDPDEPRVTERHDEDRGMWLFIGGMGWGVLCSILAIMSARALGWL